jgi:hypothetical protein
MSAEKERGAISGKIAPQEGHSTHQPEGDDKVLSEHS